MPEPMRVGVTGPGSTAGTGPAGRSAPSAAARLAVLVLACLALLLVQVAAGTPASAHSALVSTTPAAGSAVDGAPSEVTLTFNQPVNTRFSQVRVTGPDGRTWESGEPQVSGATVTQPLDGLGAAGAYEVAWRVVSADGHPISGTFGFTLTTAAVSSPSPAAEPARDDRGPAVDPGDDDAGPSADARSAEAAEDDGGGWLLPAVGLGAVLLLAAAVAWWASRRRGTRATAG